jgi:hypothetical protein
MPEHEQPTEREQQGVEDRITVRPQPPEETAERIREEAGLAPAPPDKRAQGSAEERKGHRDAEHGDRLPPP